MRIPIIIFVLFILIFPSLARAQMNKPFEIYLSTKPFDFKIIQLEMKPDPVQEGQLIHFEVVISNASPYSAKVNLFLKERDKIISSLYDVRLYPGYNQVVFPKSQYRFLRNEHCFTVEVDIGRTRRAVDTTRKFCARKSYYGWTLGPFWIGPLFVESLEMYPDPAQPGQEIKLKVRLRNDGPSIRASIRINDRDEVVAELREVFLPGGYGEYYFPYTRYFFQRQDHCFTVYVDVENTLLRVDSAREFCARSLGWTLRP